MTNPKLKISFCIPVYNEEKVLLKNIIIIKKGLDKIIGKNNFEIIAVNNASTDNTAKLLSKVKIKNVKTHSIKQRGIGAAFKLSLKKAKYNYLLLSAIDLPFGFSDLKQMIKFSNKYDIIFGSKAHPNSKVYISFKRNLYSFIYRLFIRLFFNLKQKDTQGTIFLNKKGFLKILKNCTSDNAFFTTQIAIWAKLKNIRTAEVPVNMKKQLKHKSKYSLLKDGTVMFSALLKEFLKIRLGLLL